MANSIDTKIHCIVCGKEKRAYECKGCLQYYCLLHLSDHHQTLDMQLDQIENKGILFQEKLIEQIKAPENHSFFEQINQWENDSIKNIQQIAKENRRMLRKYIVEHMNKLEIELSKLTKDVEQIRKEKDFNEIDLNKLKEKLQKLNDELDKPSAVSIQQHSTPSIHKLVVTTHNNNINPPKRPLSGFFIFSQDERSHIKNKNPSLSIADIAKEIGKRWKELSDDAREKYNQKAAMEKLKYEQELLKYKNNSGTDSPAKGIADAKALPKKGAAQLFEEINDDDDDEDEE